MQVRYHIHTGSIYCFLPHAYCTDADEAQKINWAENIQEIKSQLNESKYHSFTALRIQINKNANA